MGSEREFTKGRLTDARACDMPNPRFVSRRNTKKHLLEETRMDEPLRYQLVLNLTRVVSSLGGFVCWSYVKYSMYRWPCSGLAVALQWPCSALPCLTQCACLTIQAGRARWPRLSRLQHSSWFVLSRLLRILEAHSSNILHNSRLDRTSQATVLFSRGTPPGNSPGKRHF